MTLQKAVAIAVICFVLTMQVAQIFPPGMPPNERFWPFVDWPMYSSSFGPGMQLSRHSLRVRRCDPGAPVTEVASNDLHVERFVFYKMLATAADTGQRGRAMADTLAYLLTKKWKDPVCVMQVWRQTLRIGKDGLDRLDVPWQLVRERRSADGASPPDQAAARSAP
jgi:hypothetical protein